MPSRLLLDSWEIFFKNSRRKLGFTRFRVLHFALVVYNCDMRIKPSWHDTLPLIEQKCVECGKKFKTWRKRMYCSASCSTAVQTRRFRRRRQAEIRAAKKLQGNGESKWDETLSAAEFAAMTTLVSAIMNFDEFVVER